MQTRLLFLLLLLLSVSPLHTKLAGLAWLMLLMAAIFSIQRTGHPVHTDVRLAMRHWLVGTGFFMATHMALALVWPAPDSLVSSDMNSGFRLLTAAWATLVLLKRTDPLYTPIDHANTAVAMALVLGFLLVLVVGRELPSHPIPWAVSMAILVAFLVPHAMAKETVKHKAWAYGVAAALGVFAVLLSQSRGAYVIIFWPLVLLVTNNNHRHNRPLLVWAGGMGVLGVCVLTTLALLPADPLRLREAWTEVDTTLKTQDFNSSLGGRVYLLQTGWTGFMESPWIGLGATERKRRLQSAGLELPAPAPDRYSHVRTLGHVHNQYLHQAMDGGLLGLSGLLALLGALVAAAWRLQKTHRIASQQLAGIAFVHAIASLSNVNFAHNYYALMLGMGISVVLLQAASNPAMQNRPFNAAFDKGQQQNPP